VEQTFRRCLPEQIEQFASLRGGIHDAKPLSVATQLLGDLGQRHHLVGFRQLDSSAPEGLSKPILIGGNGNRIPSANHGITGGRERWLSGRHEYRGDTEILSQNLNAREERWKKVRRQRLDFIEKNH
jgi:hypothetical protein